MLRSMIIGLAIAALLQFGGYSFVPPTGVALTAQRIDWVTAQTNALTHLLCDGYTLLTR
jgi:hypothetical protein